MNAVERWSREWEGPGAAERWSREWEGPSEVWMFDRDGNPVALPPEAIGFRVRRLPPGSRGLGAPVRDESGAWLLVPRDVEREELADLVGYLPGKYKLVAVDARQLALRDVPIVVFAVTPTMARQAGRMAECAAPSATAASSAAPSRNPIVLELVRTLRMVLVETFATLREVLGAIQAQAVELVRSLSELVRASAEVVTAAGKAGVARRAGAQPVPVAPVVPEPDPRSTPAAVASEPDGGRGATIAATRGDEGELAGDPPELGASAAASVQGDPAGPRRGARVPRGPRPSGRFRRWRGSRRSYGRSMPARGRTSLARAAHERRGAVARSRAANDAHELDDAVERAIDRLGKALRDRAAVTRRR